MTFLQITYDSSQFYFDSQQLHDYIVGLPGIASWWHYLPNVYIVKTTNSEKAIADAILSQFNGLRFLITRIDINSSNGALPQAAWDWINNENKINRGFVKLSKVQQPKTLNEILGLRSGQVKPQNPPTTLEEWFNSNKKK